MAVNVATLIPASEKAKNVATETYVDTSAATITDNIYYPGTTQIDGAAIKTGTITAGHITTAGLDAGVIKSGVIYNTGANADTYTMKIDLDNGEIHIR